MFSGSLELLLASRLKQKVGLKMMVLKKHLFLLHYFCYFQIHKSQHFQKLPLQFFGSDVCFRDDIHTQSRVFLLPKKSKWANCDGIAGYKS